MSKRSKSRQRGEEIDAQIHAQPGPPPRARAARGPTLSPNCRYGIETLEERLLFNAGGGWTAGGVVGTYYSGTNYTGASFQRTDVRVDFAPGTELPGGAPTSDPTFGAVKPSAGDSVVWTGSLVPAYTENYTLKLYGTANDSSSLVINGQTVIATGTGNRSAQYSFTANTTYSVVLDYSHSANSTWQMQLHWQSNGGRPFAEEAIETATPVGLNEANDPGLFANVLASSGTFHSTTGGTVTLDSNGWPTTDFQISSTWYYDNYFDGTYLLQFSGQAQLSSSNLGSTPVTFTAGAYTNVATLPSGAGYNSTTGITTALVNVTYLSSSNGNFCTLKFTSTQRNGEGTNTGVTNITLMRPTTEGGTTDSPAGTFLTPAATASIAPIALLRTMGMTNTNGNRSENWSDRPLPGNYAYAFPGGSNTLGTPWEYIIMMANETGKDVY